MSKFIIQENISDIKGLTLITPKCYADSRGYFLETYNERELSKLGFNHRFVQDNQSLSKKGVLRGLHFQVKHTQGKLVRAISGSFYDVAIDLRKNSPTFGKWYGVVLSAENMFQLYLPEGFAHGLLVLEDNTIFSAKVTDYQYKKYADGVAWDDIDINISWPLHLLRGTELILSDADKNRHSLKYLIENNRLPGV